MIGRGLMFLEEPEWKQVFPNSEKKKIWGSKNSRIKLSKKFLYVIKANKPEKHGIGIVYIGKQKNSDRLKNFVQAYLAFSQLLKIINGNIKSNFNSKLKGVPQSEFGPEFSMVSGLSINFTNISKLYCFCTEKNIDFDKLDFEIWINENEKMKEADAFEAFEKDSGMTIPIANGQRPK